MLSYDSDSTVKKIAYVVINYDDPEYGYLLDQQLNEFKAANRFTDLEIIFETNSW